MFGVNLVFLTAACLIAFLSPVWGFTILLLVTSTLFHLEQYLTVSLPVGYIEPTEALVITMLASVFLNRSSSVFQKREDAGSGPIRSGSGKVWPIIGPYCAWQSACVLIGLTNWAGTENFRFGIRFLLSGVLPWTSLYVLSKLSTDQGRRIFRNAYYLTLLTACTHIALQVFDNRALMKAAYYWVQQNSDQQLWWLQGYLDEETFVRGLPQGILLILFFTLLKLGQYGFSRRPGRIQDLLATALLFSAMFITITRSYVIILALGILAMFALSVLGHRFNAGGTLRIAVVIASFIGAALAYNAVRPQFLDFWSERVNAFYGEDYKIFSEENRARGLDNIASARAIADHPIFGLGTPSYPSEYSMRSGGATDTHPMLSVGLVGGVPAMLLIFIMQIWLILPSLRVLSRYPALASDLLPFVSVTIMNTLAVNLSGGGGTLFGPQILFVTIFTNEMWNRHSFHIPGWSVMQRPRYAAVSAAVSR